MYYQLAFFSDDNMVHNLCDTPKPSSQLCVFEIYLDQLLYGLLHQCNALISTLLIFLVQGYSRYLDQPPKRWSVCDPQMQPALSLSLDQKGLCIVATNKCSCLLLSMSCCSILCNLELSVVFVYNR